ncbi:MAG: exodeoxyribonuclease III [Culicoidibacterales bacterium]
MKMISWNVNGLRAVMKKGFEEFLDKEDADFICLQEIKLQQGQIDLSHLPYKIYWNYAQKKGYSGTAILTKHEPLAVFYGIDMAIHDDEGRVITLEYANFYLVTVYTPNAKRDLSRIPYRMTWEDDFRAYLLSLNGCKPVIVCGDLNVAHTQIDLANPKTNKNNAGFTLEERSQFSKLLENGFIDSYRYLYPDDLGAYSWWSYMAGARERNIGWRIDYFCICASLKGQLVDAFILPNQHGSDHCPVGIIIDIKTI